MMMMMMNAVTEKRANWPHRIIGMQMKHEMPEPTRPKQPVQRRPNSFEFIMNTQTMYAGISNAPDTNALM